MIKILFVCHGNICRSPMAEFIMKYLVHEEYCDDKFFIASAATSSEEIGNDIYPPAQRELTKRGIPFEHRQARRLKPDDFDEWDCIIIMDHENLYGVQRIMKLSGREESGKVKMLLSFAGENDSEVSDPWYTRNFARAYDDIYRGCKGLLDYYTRRDFQA